jgi:hypothetical protein
MVTAINDIDVTAKVGSYIKPDGWPIGACLEAGDSFSPLSPANSPDCHCQLGGSDRNDGPHVAT